MITRCVAPPRNEALIARQPELPPSGQMLDLVEEEFAVASA